MFIPSLIRFTTRSLRRLPYLGGAAAAGWVGYSAFSIDHDLPLPSPVPGSSRTLEIVDAGRVTVYEATVTDADSPTGPPVVLIHGVHAAASAYDMRPLFTALGWHRRVIAFDLPGFGQSERSDRRYTPEMMTAAVVGVLEKVAGEPADLVGLSLGSEYAAAAAIARPDLVRSVTMISPTGMGGDATHAHRPDVPALLKIPVLGQAFFDLLVTNPSIRYFLGKSFAGDVDGGYAGYARLAGHRPGARHAPLAFVSGLLFTPEVDEAVYRKLSQPVLVLYDRDPYSSFDVLPEIVGDLPNWRAVRIAGTAGLPHFERPNETVAALNRFWAEAETG